MKKFFTLVMALVAVMAVNAVQVTFNFTDPSSLGITPPEASKGTNITAPVVVDGVTLTVTSGSTATRIWNSNGSYDLRIYNTGTLTFTATEEITAVEFSGAAISFSEFTGQTWAGTPATSVTFTATATSKINTIKLTIGETPVVWKPDTISVSQANALIAENDSHDHYVIGVLMGAPFNTYSDFSGSVSFWLSDVENPNDSIEFYQGTGEGEAKWASLMEAQEILHEGDTVMVYAGALTLYTAKNITEITGGHYVEMIGANPNPPVVEYEELTVAEALAKAQELNPEKGKSKTTNQIYAVYGYVVGISGTKTNTYYMADEAGAYGEFQAYQCAEIDAEVAEGDYVVVTGPITHYFGYDKENPDDESKYYHNYEISGGKLEHAVAPEGIENVVLTEKAQKVMVDGVMYIVRDNKMFDVRGAQVR